MVGNVLVLAAEADVSESKKNENEQLRSAVDMPFCYNVATDNSLKKHDCHL